MSTATNGAATETSFKAVKKATKGAGTTVADAASSSDPLVEIAGGSTRDGAYTWLAASKRLIALTLDAYDGAVRAVLDYAEHAGTAAAGQAGWAIELTKSNSKIVSELAATYTNAARALLNT
jgi:hypothetical protein